MAFSYTHPPLTTGRTAATGCHADFFASAIPRVVARPSAATRAYAANVVRGRSNATAFTRVFATEAASCAVSALGCLSGLWEQGEYPAPQDGRTGQLECLAPRDGAAGQSLGKSVKGVFLRLILSGGSHPNLIVFCRHRVSSLSPHLPEAVKPDRGSKISCRRFCRWLVL
jgi:hypothetical protein